MKWQGRRTSRNIEDRGRSGGAARKGGVGGLAAIVILVVGWYFGMDVSGFVDTGNGGISATQSAEITLADERAAQFVSVIPCRYRRGVGRCV